jgi:hypothetical protein
MFYTNDGNLPRQLGNGIENSLAFAWRKSGTGFIQEENSRSGRQGKGEFQLSSLAVREEADGIRLPVFQPDPVELRGGLIQDLGKRLDGSVENPFFPRGPLHGKDDVF